MPGKMTRYELIDLILSMIALGLSVLAGLHSYGVQERQIALQNTQTELEERLTEFEEANAKLSLARELIGEWQSNLTKHGQVENLTSAEELLHNATRCFVDGDYDRTVLIVQQIVAIVPSSVTIEAEPSLWPLFGDPYWQQRPLDFWQGVAKVNPAYLRFIPRSFWDRQPISYWKQHIPAEYWKYLPFYIA